MSLNPTKSIFGVIVGNILRHIVSNSGIKINLEMVIEIHNLQAPYSKNKKSIFHG
jgi:hypothetical protein